MGLHDNIRSRGMYFAAKDLPEFHAMVHNWPSENVDVVCVTDGSRVLGLGDLGIQGMGISIGKLDLYVAAGGIHPSRILPVAIDVGTDNETLRNDPFYMGLKQPRLQVLHLSTKDMNALADGSYLLS